MSQKILFVEHNPDVMILVKSALEAHGYEFIWAPNGLEGVAVAEERLPDLILVDTNLPDIDGCEVARQVRCSGEHALEYAPIIAVIANASRGEGEKALAAGCDVYLASPINVRELWARVDEFMVSAQGV